MAPPTFFFCGEDYAYSFVFSLSKMVRSHPNSPSMVQGRGGLQDSRTRPPGVHTAGRSRVQQDPMIASVSQSSMAPQQRWSSHVREGRARAKLLMHEVACQALHCLYCQLVHLLLNVHCHLIAHNLQASKEKISAGTCPGKKMHNTN